VVNRALSFPAAPLKPDGNLNGASSIHTKSDARSMPVILLPDHSVPPGAKLRFQLYPPRLGEFRLRAVGCCCYGRRGTGCPAVGGLSRPNLRTTACPWVRPGSGLCPMPTGRNSHPGATRRARVRLLTRTRPRICAFWAILRGATHQALRASGWLEKCPMQHAPADAPQSKDMRHASGLMSSHRPARKTQTA
jgi:hypothetical protein